MLLMLWSGLALGADGAAALEAAAALVAIEDRVAGLGGGAAAQDRVAERLAGMGYEVTRYPARYDSWLVGCWPGRTGPTALVLAHTDAVHPSCPGAVDNAGSVGVALAAAERLAGVGDTPLNVCFAFPDGEEVGLLGAKSLAKLWGARFPDRPLALAVAMEFMGNGELVAANMDRTWGADGVRWVLENGDADLPYAYRVVARVVPSATARSDHAPFAAQGVPSVFLVGRDEDGVYWPYHTARDTLDQLDRAALGRAVDGLVGLVSASPPPTGGDASLPLPGTRWMLPEWLIHAATAAGLLLGFAAPLDGSARAGTQSTAVGAAAGAVVETGGAAVVGLLLSALATGAGAGAWLLGALGRPEHGALAAPLTLAWAGAAAAVVLLACGRLGPRAVGAGALAAAALAAPALLVDVTLSFSLAVGALGLGILQRARGLGPIALFVGLTLALPLPIYLSLPDMWRELVFQFILPEGGLWWMPARGLLWWPLITAALALPPRARRLWPVAAAIAIAGIAWALATDPWAAPYFQREMLWPG